MSEEASQNSGNLHATLPISPLEAQVGINRAITLPGGRKVMISVPPGAYEGQVITLNGLGEQPRPNSPAGMLTLVITITPPRDRPPNTPSSGHTITLALRRSSRILQGKMLFLTGLILLLIVGSSALLYVVSSHLDSSGASTTTAAPTAGKAIATIAASNPDPYPPKTGTLVLYDPLRDNSRGYKWDTVGGKNGSCNFTNGAYAIKTSITDYSFYCTAETTDFSNFAYEVQMKIVQGDAGGLAFRVTNANNTELYYFRVNQDGTYALIVFQPHGGYPATTGSSTAIHTGLNQTNIIAVVANSHTLALYINRTLVKTITNTAYTHGQIGLVANDITNPTEVMYSNARVWKL